MTSSQRSRVDASSETRQSRRHDLLPLVFRALTEVADLARRKSATLHQSGTTVGIMAMYPRRTEPPCRRATS